MNRKRASLLTFSLLFCLASCGGGQNIASSSSEASSSSMQTIASESSSQQSSSQQSSAQSKESSSSSSSQSSSSSKESTSSSEESVSSEISSSSESSSSENPGESELKKRIATLAGNVDELPNGDTMFLAKQEKAKLMRDLTTPSDAYYETNPYYSFNSETWEKIDFLKDESIKIRDYVLEKTKQLNTWISDPDAMYCLDYDSLADEITIKYRRSIYYYEITSGYNADGKIVLKTTCYTDEDFRFFIDNLFYVEGEKGILCSSVENIDPANYKNFTLIESDLANNKITKVERTIINDEVQNSDYLHTILLQEENGIKCVSSQSKSGQLDINIYDEKGYSLGHFTTLGNDCTGTFSLYELDGWDSVVFNEQIPAVELTIGGVVHSETEYFSNPSCMAYLILDSAGFDVFPALVISCQEKVLDYGGFLDVIQKNYGLTAKHDYTESIERMMANIDEEAKNRSAFGYSDLAKMDLVTFEYLYDNYNRATLTLEDVRALSSISTVWVDDQEETDFQIGYLDGEIAGEIAFDFVNMTMNPKDVVVTIPNSSLLSPNLSYQVKIVSNGTNGKNILCESNIASPNGGLSFSFPDESIGLLEANLAEEGKIEVVVGVVASDGFHRISKNMPLVSNVEDASYPLADFETVLEEDFIKYNVVVSRALRVINNGNGLFVYIETSAIQKNYQDAKVEGKLGFDLENMTINPEDISVQIEDTSFLDENIYYQTKLVATYPNGESKVICEGEYAKINDGLTLNFYPSSASILEFVKEEECTIEAVVYARTSNGETQVSKKALVSGDVASGTYALPDLETIVEEDSKQYKVTTHRNLVIDNENGLKLHEEITSIEKEEIAEEPSEEAGE